MSEQLNTVADKTPIKTLAQRCVAGLAVIGAGFALYEGINARDDITKMTHVDTGISAEYHDRSSVASKSSIEAGTTEVQIWEAPSTIVPEVTATQVDIVPKSGYETFQDADAKFDADLLKAVGSMYMSVFMAAGVYVSSKKD
jgi:hypothetical protein